MFDSPAPEIMPPRQGHSRGCVVVVVLIVVGILVTIAIPTNSCPPISGKVMSTRAGMKGVEIALKGYHTEYNTHLPARLGLKENQDYMVDAAILQPLMVLGPDEANPRKIKFYDPPAAKKDKNGFWKGTDGSYNLRDFWGGPFRIRFDADGDGRIPNPEDPAGDPISSWYILYSAGPDGDFNTWKDNVKSWQ